MNRTLRFSFLYIFVISASGAPRSLSDQKLFAAGKTFSEACAAATGAKAQLVVSQKWKVKDADCHAKVQFSATGSITYSGSVVFSGPVSGTLDTHFVRETGGTLSISDKSSTLYLSWWGAVADGTDESAKFQAALDAAHASGGGRISVSHRPSCYLAQNLAFYSNTTIFSDSQATCVKKPDGGGLYQIFHNDYSAPVSNVHFENFTIDGNRDKQPGVTGDSGLIGIYFAGASDSTIERMVIRNAYTDGVLIGCWGYYPDHMTGVGTNVRILQSVITNSRRNNISVICSRGTVIQDSELSYANGTVPAAGVDVEPDYAAQIVDGFRIVATEVHHNAGDGVLLQAKAEHEALSVENVYSHDNGMTGLYGVDIGGAGELEVSGGVFGNNRGSAGIRLAGWSRAILSGESTYGSSRGILVMANISEVLLGISVVSGTLYDLSVDGPNSTARLYGVWLAHGVIQTGGDNCIPYFPDLLELKIGCKIASDGK